MTSALETMLSLPEDQSVLKGQFLSWLTRRQRAHAPVVEDALDALYDARDGNLNEACLARLQRGLELSGGLSYPLAEHVCALAAGEPRLRALLLRLGEHRLASVRRNVMMFCLHDGPDETMSKLLVRGLSDRSKAVRLKAADVILRTERRELKEHVRLRGNQEPDRSLAETLRLIFGLLDRNWYRRPNGESIAVYHPRGGISGLFVIPGEDEPSLERRVAELRALRA
ncbi:MAG: hypothetical protein AB8I08_08960 [Sandaracinaceae bacterium]